MSEEAELAAGATAATPGEASIPLSVPELGGNELRYLEQCVATNWVSYAGPFVGQFEQMLAEAVGVEGAAATNSGTAALHIALLVAGVEPGDEVIVSDLTFIAPVNAIRYCGAYPVLMDAEPEYWQMDVEKVAQFLQQECVRENGGVRNRRSRRRVHAILPVHVLGHPVAMTRLLELAQNFGLVVVEDATEALGARYRGRPVGSLGDIACFSFNGNKILTTGGGGMIVTARPEWARLAKHLTTQAKSDATEYLHDRVGYNYRLTNLQAAVGVAQMEVLARFLARKRAIAARYDAALASVPGLEAPRQAPWAEPNWWLYTVRVRAETFGMTARELQRRLEAMGIQTRPLWGPVHDQAPYRDAQAYRTSVTPELYRDCLSLPCSSGLSEGQQERVLSALNACAGARK